MSGRKIKERTKRYETEYKEDFMMAGVVAMIAGLTGCGTKKSAEKQQKLMWVILIM